MKQAMKTPVRAGSSAYNRAQMGGHDNFRTGVNPKQETSNISYEATESDCDAVDAIASFESDKRVIRYVIGHLSAELDGLPEDVLLRLKNARNAAVVHKRS